MRNTNAVTTVFDFNGKQIKVENGKIYTRKFGSTLSNNIMHYHWCEVLKDKLPINLKLTLKEKKLI